MAKNTRLEHTPRFHALTILYQIETEHIFSNHALNTFWQTQRPEDERDRSLISMLVQGVLQWKKRIDWILAQFVKTDLSRLDRWTYYALQLGVFQIVFLDRVPDWAAVNESVRLAKYHSKHGAAGLVNAVLRRVAGEYQSVVYPDIETDPVQHVAIVYSHPEWMVARWLARYGLSETISLCSFNNAMRPIVLRVNRLRTTPAEVERLLAADGIHSVPGRYHPASLVLQQGVDINRLPLYQEGLAHIQDESASLVSALVAPEAGETILDTCAAPGGKTTHLAELMNDQGAIIALDRYEQRLKILEGNYRRLGITCIKTQVQDAQEKLDLPPVDRVLVDAPCSGLGVLARRGDARWNKEPSDVTELQALQKALLESAVQQVKPGGRLVYSTCTLEPEENEEIVTWFLDHYGQLFTPLSAQDLPIPAEVIDESGFYRALPHRHGIDGAFAAGFIRKR